MPERSDETFEHDVLTALGSEIKLLEGGKIGGYLVRFGSPDDTDLEGDFFTKDTDFGSSLKSVTLWDHSMDPVLGDIELGEVTMKKTDIGVWVEGVLSLRKDYEAYLDEEFGEGGSEKFLKAIKAFIKGGVAGWSSGVPAHRVRRQEIKDTSTGATKARHILKWPLGLDASITPTPAEPRNKVVSLKSIEGRRTINWKSLLATDESEAGAEESKGPDSPPAAKTGADSREAANQAANQQPTEKETMADEKKNVEPKEDEAPQETKSNTGAPTFTEADVQAILDKAQKRWKDSQPDIKGVREIPKSNQDNTGAPAFVKKLGDSPDKRYARWIKNGDTGAMKGMEALGFEEVTAKSFEIKASNAVDMQVGTDAEGGHLVPEGHFNGIMARRDQNDLSRVLGFTKIPGVGTTVHVPLDNEADGEFVSTNEEGSYDKDTPSIGNQAFTLVKYTKNVPLSEELLEDETVGLMQFIENWVGRGIAKTNNSLIVTEVEASGTEYAVLTQGGIAAGEIETIAFNDTLGPYLDGGNIAWVTRAASYGSIVSLTGNDRLYAEQFVRSSFGTSAQDRPTLLRYPVFFSDKVDADGSSGNKPIYFGDWSQMGVYEGNSMKVLRDPYSEAATGQVNLWYSYRIDFEILQAEALGYGRNSTT